MPRRVVAEVELDVGVAERRVLLPRLDESVSNPALVEHLQGSNVEAAGSRSVDDGRFAELDNHHVNARQRQFAGKHQPRWPGSCNDNFVFVLRTHAVE